MTVSRGTRAVTTARKCRSTCLLRGWGQRRIESLALSLPVALISRKYSSATAAKEAAVGTPAKKYNSCRDLSSKFGSAWLYGGGASRSAPFVENY